MRPLGALEHVREQLTIARRKGRPFDAAWANALASLPPEGPKAEKGSPNFGTVDALQDTREAWQSAYDGTPAPESPVTCPPDAFDLQDDAIDPRRP